MKKFERPETIEVDNETKQFWKIKKQHGDNSRIARLSKGKFSVSTISAVMLSGRGNEKVINAINLFYESRK